MLVPSMKHIKLGLVTMVGLGVCTCTKPKGTVVAPSPVAHNGPTTMPASMPSYIGPKGGFVMKYPAGWEPRTCHNVTLELVPKGATSEARIVTVDVPWVPWHPPGMISIARVEKGYLDDMKKHMKDVVVENDAPQPMPGAQARRLHCKAVEDGVPTVIDAVVVLHQESVYILSAETDVAGAADADATLETVLGNWQWK